ncbi:MAG: hypothetical protein CMP65_02460 [Flavobacteriales bacterium]|nr:hypothetical protein [Flavobacteriales bacterium]|tara:strand:- start:7951 stop:9411 length:1461 start_codon:yes stop_codon:yes gene_type:complete
MRIIALVIILICYICSLQQLCAQKLINIIESNLLEQSIINDTTYQKFSGNVIIEYQNFKIYSDTVLINDDREIVRAWGNTSIFNDTLHCQSDSVAIIQKLDQMVFFNNSKLKTKQLKIISDEIKYNFETKNISYNKGGSVKKENYVILSDVFSYNMEKQISCFEKNVKISGDDLQINGENIMFTDDTIKFNGITKINKNQSIIKCINGYLKESEKLELFDFVEVKSNNQIIKAKYLKRNEITNHNYFKKNIEIQIDSNTYIFAESLDQNKNKSNITGNCKIILHNTKDSTIISGEQIDIDDNKDIVEMKNNISISGSNIDGKCEKIIFTDNYTKIQMIKNPVLWLDQSQLSGDEILLQTVDNNLDSLIIPKNPFIIYPNDSIPYYNQIKGKNLNGKFGKSHISYIDVKGNGELKSFTLDDQSNKININNTKSSKIKINFKQNDINRVLCTGNIESDNKDFEQNDPLLKLEKTIFLKGFILKKKDKK